MNRAQAVYVLGRAIDQALARVPARARECVRRRLVLAAVRRGEKCGNVALGDVLDDIIADYGQGGQYSGGSTFVPGAGTTWQPNPFNQQGSTGSVGTASGTTGSGIANLFLGSDNQFSSDDVGRWGQQLFSVVGWFGSLVQAGRGAAGTPSGGVVLGPPATVTGTPPPQPSGGLLGSIPPVAIYVGVAGAAALVAYLLIGKG